MFKRILVPVDGSKAAGLGLDTAIKLAKDQDAVLIILHVVDNRVITQGMGMGGIGIERLFDSLRAGGKQILAKAQARALKQQARAKIIIDESNVRSVSDVIVRQARKLRSDLIVIGTHGRRGLSRLVMGSDAEGVVRTAPSPVMLVRSRSARR